jgi:hypothetical protein
MLVGDRVDAVRAKKVAPYTAKPPSPLLKHVAEYMSKQDNLSDLEYALFLKTAAGELHVWEEC